MKNLLSFFYFQFFVFLKKKFLTLNNIKDIENTYYSKSLLDYSTKNDNAKQAHLLRLFNIKDEISEANQVKKFHFDGRYFTTIIWYQPNKKFQI
jgi:hypothetical protein